MTPDNNVCDAENEHNCWMLTTVWRHCYALYKSDILSAGD